MKIKLLMYFIILVATLPLACVSDDKEIGISEVPRLEVRDVEGDWVGYDDGSPSFCRLLLNPNGSGSCVVLYLDDKDDLYSVRWTLDTNTIRLTLTPQKNAEPIIWKVNGCTAYEMLTVMRGATNNWTHPITLYQSRRLDHYLRTTKEKLNLTGQP